MKTALYWFPFLPVVLDMLSVPVVAPEYTPALVMLVKLPAPTFSCHCIVGVGLPPVALAVKLVGSPAQTETLLALV